MPPKRRAAAEQDANSPTKRAKRTEIPVSPPEAIKKTSTAQAPPAKAPRAAKSKSSDSTAISETQVKTKSNGQGVEIKTETKKTIRETADSTTRITKVAKVKSTKNIADDTDEEDIKSESEGKVKKQPVKRKSKEEKAAEAMPPVPRTMGLRMYVGAHVSGAGGVQNSVHNAVQNGGNAFAVFLKSQRKWENPPLKDEHRDEFKHLCGQHNYAADKHVLPHGSYLVNLAQIEKDKADQAYNSFLDDMKRCDALGIKLYNFHPGNTGPHPRSEAISRIAQQLNKAIKATANVVPVLETMAGQGNAIGSSFEDLRDIISEVEDKTRVGVCLDTCHVFAAGYDLRTPEAFHETVDRFDKIVGLKYLRAFHMNDSKAPLGSHRDLHQNIGVGFLGLRAFHNVMNDSRFEDMPMVLETPTSRPGGDGKPVEDKNVWGSEIKLLESLIGMDATSAEFRALESSLAARGAVERAKMQEQVDKKVVKETKKTAAGQKRKKKTIEEDTDVTD